MSFATSGEVGVNAPGNVRELKHVVELLAKTGGVKARAAALLGMPIRTFNRKFKQYG